MYHILPDVVFTATRNGLSIAKKGTDTTISVGPVVAIILSRANCAATHQEIVSAIGSITKSDLESSLNALIENEIISSSVNELNIEEQENYEDLIMGKLVPIAETASLIAGLLRTSPVDIKSYRTVEHDLDSVLVRMRILEEEMAEENRSKSSGQLKLVDADKHTKLHIGAGGYKIDGWMNVDFHPSDIELDVRRELPFAKGSVRYVYMSHVLEHFRFPGEAARVLSNVRHCMSLGGVLRIVVPDIKKYLQAYVDEDISFFEGRQKTWTWWEEDWTHLEQVLRYAGASPEPSSFFKSHKFGYDFETLSKLLKSIGGFSVSRSTYMASEHAALQVDMSSKVSGAHLDEVYYSLFVDAIAT